MKRTHSIAVWSFILIPLIIIAIYIGETLTSDTAALALGGILGIMGAAAAAGIIFLIRDERHRRQREEARRPAPRPTPEAPAPTYIDATWRELPPTPPAPAPRVIASRSGEAISPPAPTRALTRRS